MALNENEFSAPDDFDERQATAPKVRAPKADEVVLLRDDWVWAKALLVKHNNKLYLVKAALSKVLTKHAFTALLFAVASSTGDIFLWPVKKATKAVEAAEAALGHWATVTWVNASRGYTVQTVEGQPEKPNWRYETFDEFVEVAFAGRVLASADDAVVKAVLAGE